MMKKIIYLLLILFLCSSCAEKETLEIRIINGVVQYKEGLNWKVYQDLDSLKSEDPFEIAKKERMILEEEIKSEKEVIKEELKEEFIEEDVLENIGTIPVYVPKPSSNNDSSGIGGSSGGSNGGSTGGSSGGSSSGGQTPATPPSSSDGEDIEWSGDFL